MEKQTKLAYTLGGRIKNQNNLPLAGLIVIAFDKDPKSSDDPLGTAITDAEGKYAIHFGKAEFQKRGVERTGPDIYVRVYDEDKFLGESPIKRNAKQTSSISLRVAIAVEDSSPPSVAELQDSLRALLDGRFFQLDDAVRAALANDLNDERNSARTGDGTRRLIGMYVAGRNSQQAEGAHKQTIAKTGKIALQNSVPALAGPTHAGGCRHDPCHLETSEKA